MAMVMLTIPVQRRVSAKVQAVVTRAALDLRADPDAPLFGFRVMRVGRLL